MFYFATGLHMGLLNADKVSSTIDWIIKHMGVCFVPAGVGIMNYFDLIKSNGWQLLLFTIVSSVLLLIIVGSFYQYLLRGKPNE
ncbi:CidA/LrgA family protein [Thalassotalea sp. M1531]|uniref:CidA/LrgA family protein n=2 Tax=Thalassotalea algicola TaxID=2716224 RepID=A0A7Y0LE33_9GAMM|nr:CidA/LrgA family protein [Thalassotalea algicola]